MRNRMHLTASFYNEKQKNLSFCKLSKTEISLKRDVIENNMHLTFCWKYKEECIAVSPMALSELVLKI